jgi:YHS domain-containing protein
MQNELRERLEYLMQHAEEERSVRMLQQKKQMSEIQQFHDLFITLTQLWFDDIILPKLFLLKEMFPNADAPSFLSNLQSCTLIFEQGNGYVVRAKFSVRLREKVEAGTVAVECETEIFPILVEYERKTHAEFPLMEVSAEQIAAFMDENILRFADVYLSIHNTNSPYMKDKRAIDTVCGMDIFIADAAATRMYKKTRYYFCSKECLNTFEQNADKNFRQ